MRLFAWFLTTLGLLIGTAVAQEEEQQKTYPRFRFDGGQLQLQYDSEGLGSNSSTSVLPADNGIAPFPAADSLSIRRARFNTELEFSPHTSLSSQIDLNVTSLDVTGVRFTILDLYLDHHVDDLTHLRGGQFKVPFGWENYRSSKSLPTVERSDVSRSYEQRDIGIGFFQDAEKLDFGVGVFQGQGQGRRDLNPNKDVAGRILWKASPKLQVGMSGYLGTFQEQADTIPDRRIGAELHYQLKRLLLETEFVYSDGYNTFSEADTQASGLYLTGTYELNDRLDAVLHYDQFDPDLAQVDRHVSNDRINSRSRFVVGLNYYLNREPAHRVMLNYEVHKETEGPQLWSNGVRVRYQYSW